MNVGMVVNGDVTINNYNAGVEFYADYSGDDIQMFSDPEENDLFISSLNGTDMGLSEFAAYHFRNRFHCTTAEKFYEFRGHCWSDDAAELAYREALGQKSFVAAYQRAALQFENATAQTEEVKRKAKALRKLAVSLEDHRFRERIVADSVMKFHRRRPHFATKLNTQNIIVFEDGVYDLDTNSFGPGCPDVPVTLCVPQPFVPYDPDNEKVHLLTKFLSEILPDDGSREYTLKVLAVSLTTTPLQYFFIWTGTGGNGKSRLVNLMESCLGPFFQSVNPTLLTRKREEASHANEALVSLEKARLVVFQEAESSDSIHAGTVKTLTGGDTVSTRANYGRQMKFRPVFKSLFVCNDLPRMSENTLGLWRRVRCTEFNTRFVDHPVHENERQADYDLDRKLNEAAPWFIGLLLHYWKLFQKDGLTVPGKILRATTKYQDTHDLLKDFIDDRMVRCPTENILWTELQSAYNKWPQSKSLKSQQLKEEFAKHGIEYKKTTLHGEDFCGVKGWRLLP